jgi:hypothetical protein
MYINRERSWSEREMESYIIVRVWKKTRYEQKDLYISKIEMVGF